MSKKKRRGPKKFDRHFAFGLIMGATRNYNREHPDRAIDMGNMMSVAKRCAVDIFVEARRRGLPEPDDQVVDADYQYERTKRMRPAGENG